MGSRTQSLIAVFLICLAAQLLSPEANAQETKYRFQHKAAPAHRMGTPGTALTLELQVRGTRDTGLPIRCYAVRDGALTIIPPANSFLNEYDIPIYEFKTTSPLAELSYQFILLGKNPAAQPVTSKRFTLRRQCIPSIDEEAIAKLNTKEPDSVQEQIKLYAKAARALEKEIAQYSVASEIAKDLKALLEGGEK